jgi:diacylglycerol O-acyltransferase / wax synthase
MQLGAVLVFDAGPLTLRNGGIDVERLRAYTAERLPELARARQRRVELALGRLAYFADDSSFQLDYHVRHASLPRPGDERALKRLAGRVFSQALDPDKPLWELWVVEGLEEGRFALIAKLDSALVEGGRGAVKLMAGLIGGARASSHCRVDWLALDAADVSAVCRRLAVRETDVVLAALSGGLRRLAERRGAAAEPTPIGVDRTGAALRLPVDEPDARTRLVRLRAARERGIAPALAAADATPTLHDWLAGLARAAAAGSTGDAVLTELAVNGALLLGAPLRALVPILPRGSGGGLGVSATRVGSRIFLGLAADAVSMPDLSALADGVAGSFDELCRLAAPAAKAPRPRKRRAPRVEPELR